MRSTNRRRGALVTGLLAGLATTALAHDTWLLPARFAVVTGGTVNLDLTSAMRFPQPESPPQPDRIAATGVRLGGHIRSMDVGRVAGKVLRLSAVLGEAGVAALWVESRPRTLSLEPKEVEHYLHEIGAPPAVRTRWQSGGQRWRESYAKLAKTYVRVGAPEGDRSWAEPVGQPLEMVPGRDPTSLAAGDDLPVTVLKAGKPLPGLTGAADSGGGRKPVVGTTDAGGRVTFTLDRAGPWLLKATLLQESTDTDVDWHSLFTTLTLSVRPR